MCNHRMEKLDDQWRVVLLSISVNNPLKAFNFRENDSLDLLKIEANYVKIFGEADFGEFSEMCVANKAGSLQTEASLVT